MNSIMYNHIKLLKNNIPFVYVFLVFSGEQYFASTEDSDVSYVGTRIFRIADPNMA